jgi:hypothetical protein
VYSGSERQYSVHTFRTNGKFLPLRSVNPDTYLEDIRKMYVYFMQDNATAQTSKCLCSTNV